MSDNNQYIEFDYIRVIGTILVVIGHSAYTNMMTDHGGISIITDYSRTQTILLLLVRFIYSFHMPLFFFLSGALFELGTLKGNWNSFTVVVKKKFRRLIVPLFFVGFLYAIPIKYLSGYYIDSADLLHDAFVGQMVLYDNNYLWFLLALFWCFVLSFLSHKFLNKKMIAVLSCILVILGIQIKTDIFCIRNVCYYFIWFESGRAFFDQKDRIDTMVTGYKSLLLILISSGMIYAFYLAVLKDNPYLYRFLPIFGISSIYCLLKNSRLHFETNSVFQLIKYNSFAIYLFSDSWNYIVLSLLKRFNLICMYKYDMFCLGIFVFRIVFTICISLLIKYALDRLRIAL